MGERRDRGDTGGREQIEEREGGRGRGERERRENNALNNSPC